MVGPIDYTILQDSGLVFVHVSGDLETRHILEYLATLAGDPDFDPAMDVLVDLRAVDHYAVDSTEMRTVASANAEFNREAPRTKCALVSSEDFVYGMLRMFQVLTEGQNVDIEVWRDICEAASWLGVSPARIPGPEGDSP